ncbi:MAG: copper-translocating P-type ATPase [Clostridia bacterium]|nr:copper-translocating P-type ATPase [Clostridia bacterium]
MKEERYNISGMSCAACSASVQRVVSKLDGVVSCEVNLVTEKMTVVYDETKTGPADFTKSVERAGFGISPETAEKKEKPEKTTKEKSDLPTLIVSSVLSAILLYVSMGQMLVKNLPVPFFMNMNSDPAGFALTQLLLCIPVIYMGKKFFTTGIPLLLRGNPNMDSLVAIGAGASFIYSVVMTYSIPYYHHAVHNLYYESVAVVITLVALGKHLELRSQKKTASAIKKLMELSPDTATVLRDGREITVSTQDVKVGETLVIKPGDKIPLDGTVTEGLSSADESMLTGESIPVEKSAGSAVIGGSINLNGAIYVKVTKVGEDTALAKIIKFVEDAQNKKAPISKTADKVAGIFVPAVIIIAFLAAAAWLISGKEISFVLKVFTGVLVIACPCALGLATPTAIMVGTGLGAANGILIRNGEILEITHKVKAVIFDKTGTVTVGKTTVTDICSDDENMLLYYAASAESASNHPLAKAVTEYASDKGIEIQRPESLENISGKGLKCSLDGKTILLGNAAFLKEGGIDISSYEESGQKLASEGKSLIYVAANNNVLGLIAVADSVRETSAAAIARLKKLGIHTVILSGDNKACADYIGNLVGADEVYSEVLPEQKAEIVAQIRKKYGTVMMVGDGINDAPALSEADIGCAIGSGSDIAIEAADIVLMKSDPTDVARAIRLSRLTITNIKENLFWAFCYNTVCIPIAAGVLYLFGGPLLNPMLAGLAMSLSSVFVVSNALRLRSKKL